MVLMMTWAYERDKSAIPLSVIFRHYGPPKKGPWGL
jgi:hypothetical protein